MNQTKKNIAFQICKERKLSPKFNWRTLPIQRRTNSVWKFMKDYDLTKYPFSEEYKILFSLGHN